jgi:hypothetical protein
MMWMQQGCNEVYEILEEGDFSLDFRTKVEASQDPGNL